MTLAAGPHTSATVTPRREGSARAVTEGGASVEGLPELSFVYPLPGFETLRSFVLVRMD